MLCPVPAHGWGQDAVDVLLDGIVFPHTLFQASVFGVLLAAENFIDKLPPDLVGLCIADLTRLKGLYQMVSEIVAFLHGKQPCFFKLKVCGFSTAQPNEDTSSLSAVIAFTSL